MIERVFAAIVFAACVLLLVRLGLGARRRQRLDAVLWRAVHATRHMATAARQRRANAQAAKAAADAIRRAQERGEWEGNVYKPKSFRKPPRDKMH